MRLLTGLYSTGGHSTLDRRSFLTEVCYIAVCPCVTSVSDHTAEEELHVKYVDESLMRARLPLHTANWTPLASARPGRCSLLTSQRNELHSSLA